MRVGGDGRRALFGFRCLGEFGTGPTRVFVASVLVLSCRSRHRYGNTGDGDGSPSGRHQAVD